jgi:hypothetical protein
MFTDDKLALLKQAKVREGLCIVHKEDTMIWTFFIFNSNKDNGLDVIVIFKNQATRGLTRVFLPTVTAIYTAVTILTDGER